MRDYMKLVWPVGLALLLAPLASAFPDGLERVAEQLGFAAQEREAAFGLLSGYELPFIAAPGLSTLAAAALGVLLVTCLLMLLGKSLAGAGKVTGQRD